MNSTMHDVLRDVKGAEFSLSHQIVQVVVAHFTAEAGLACTCVFQATLSAGAN